MQATAFCVAVGVVLVSVSSLSSDEVQPRLSDSGTQDPEEASDRILDSADYSDFEDYLKRFLKSDGNPISVDLARSLHAAAAWHGVASSTASERPFQLGRIIGMCEGSLVTLAPEWWKYRLQHARFADGPVAFKKEAESGWIKPFSADLKAVGNINLHYGQQRDLTVDCGDQAVRIPEDLLETAWRRSTADTLAMTYDDSNLYMCLFGPVARGYPIVAIDRTTAKIKWSANVWAAKVQAFSGPLPKEDHRIEIIAGKDEVTVFGGSFHGIYCEAFRNVDGSAVFRLNALRENSSR